MSLVPTSSSTPSTWSPPEAKAMRYTITGLIALVVISVVSLVVIKFVPTWIDAVDLLTKLTSSLTHLAITGAVLTGVIWLLYEIFSPTGKINKLISMQYASFINKLTWSLLNIDPLSPYFERQKEVRAYKSRFEDAVGRLDGIMSRWRETADKYHADAKQHERKAKGAKTAAVSDQRFENVFTIESRAYQRCLDTAQEFEGYIARVEPVRKRLHQTVEAAEMVDQNLSLDIKIARDKWAAKEAFEEVNAAGRALFRGTEKAALAAQAAELIDVKYADQLGLLENLATTTQPLLDTIELEKVSAGSELLSKWESESTKLIEGPTAPAMQDQSSGLKKLLY